MTDDVCGRSIISASRQRRSSAVQVGSGSHPGAKPSIIGDAHALEPSLWGGSGPAEGRGSLARLARPHPGRCGAAVEGLPCLAVQCRSPSSVPIPELFHPQLAISPSSIPIPKPSDAPRELGIRKSTRHPPCFSFCPFICPPCFSSHLSFSNPQRPRRLRATLITLQRLRKRVPSRPLSEPVRLRMPRAPARRGQPRSFALSPASRPVLRVRLSS